MDRMVMDTPWTPGPWRWEGDSFEGQPPFCPHDDEWTDHGPDLRGPGADSWVISSTGYDASELSVKEADARLIAAAPEMAELLVELREIADFEGADYMVQRTDALLARIRNVPAPASPS